MFPESLKGWKYLCGFQWSREVSESMLHSGSALNKGWVLTGGRRGQFWSRAQAEHWAGGEKLWCGQKGVRRAEWLCQVINRTRNSALNAKIRGSDSSHGHQRVIEGHTEMAHNESQVSEKLTWWTSMDYIELGRDWRKKGQLEILSQKFRKYREVWTEMMKRQRGMPKIFEEKKLYFSVSVSMWRARRDAKDEPRSQARAAWREIGKLGVRSGREGGCVPCVKSETRNKDLG